MVMETSLRLRGADSTPSQHGLRIHAKQKLPLASNALLQAHAEIDTSTRKPSHLALLARHFFPQLSANVGVGVQLERGNIFRYSLRGKKAVSFTADGLLGLNIKGRLLADKDFQPRNKSGAVELAWTILDFRKGQDVRLKAGYELYRKDMFAAGTDTTYIALEWAMSELMKNPSTMRKLEHEVRSCSAGGIAKADMLGAATTPYLKAVVKETLRLHPPTPLLLPRECMQDATVMGYHVAKGTLVFVNAWAINRDPASWHLPDEFLPERFLESEVDFRGGHFQFIPFGAGRRICPGMQFGLATIELALANLVCMFDWELPDGIAPGELDMSDTPGLTTPRRVGLRLIARPYQWEKQE